MNESTGKSFKVPKIKRQESKDNLRQVEVTSRDALEIVNTVKRSYLETSYTTSWELKAVMFVENRELEERYRQKKIEMKDDGRRDLVDQYAFLLFKDSNIISQVVKDGIKCRGISFNGLGNSKLGVYLCRNADIQLRLAESWAATAVTVMVFKVVQGKCKVIANNSADEGMEPTPNYDCHVFQMQPKPGEPLNIQLARSQVYFYEYTEDCEPSQYPRQCLPYAILAYTRPENIPSPVSQPQFDSYSKRPVGLADRGRIPSSDIETTKPGSTEVKPGRRDPRRASGDVKMNPLDPRVAVAEAQGLNTGLCVPHLSAAPKPIVSDPRLAQSTSVQNTAYKNIVPGMPYPGYRPKFGPAEEELERQRQLEMVQQQLQNIQKQQGPGLNLPPLLDPRLARVDPRLDPRLRESRLSTENPQESQELVIPHQPRHNSGSEDQYNKLKKKISLHDYKKKAPVPKPEPVSTTAPSQQVQSSSIYDSMKEVYQSSLQSSAAYYTSMPSSMTSETNTNAQSGYTLPDIPPSGDDEPYDPESHFGESPKQEEDIVEEPEAMAKTLNELSDPDDGSQSPSTLEEHIENEQDPLLAAAMRKLVEHSGDVSLFTEALQSLQESAEEMGERLTDPEFLVKTIAEKIEELLKQKNSKEESRQEKESSSAGVTNTTAAGVNDKIADGIQSPDAIRSPDITSKESCYSSSPLVRSIPLESQELGVEKSALAQSMQKTLEELEMIEKNKQVLNEDNTNIDLASIPVPPSPKTKPGDSVDCDINKDNLTVEEMDIDSDEASCQESLKHSSANMPQTHAKSISFNIKRTSISQGLSANVFDDENIFEDKDERKNTKFLDRLKARDNNRDIVKVEENEIVFGDEDVDLRKMVSNKRSIAKAEESYHTKKATESYNTAKVELDVFQDKDERVAPSNDLNSVFLDKDDRVNQTVNQPSSVFGLNEMGDRDDRIKSRSGSPVLQNQDIPMPNSKEIKRSQEIKIENSYTSSASVKSEMIKTESQSSEEGVSTLFDAYSVVANKSNAKKDEKMEKDDKLDAEHKVENSFGDVDWRVAAAAEMGDVDLRSSQASLRSNEDPGRSSEDPVKSSEDTVTGHEDDLDMRYSSASMSQHVESSFSRGSASEARPGFSEPFAKMNQSVQNILFSNSQKIEQYSTTSTPLDSYSTVKGSYETYSTHKIPVEAYNTSANFAGEYKTSGFTSSVPDPYSYPQTEQYSTSHIPASTSTQVPSIGGGIHNVMQNIDMFDLKNILARVGNAPAVSEPAPVTVKPTFVEPTTPPTDSDEDDFQNKPAFCTGLSFLKSKAPKVDLTRAKYTGKAKIAPDVGPPPVTPPQVSAGVRNKDRLHNQEFEPPVPSLPGFPGFGSSPVKDFDARKPTPDVTRLEGQPSNFFTMHAMLDRKTNVIPGFEGPSKTEIPGFEPVVDTYKEESKQGVGDTQGGSQPFRFSEEIPDRDFSSMWYVENPHIPESKREKKKRRDNDKSDTESDSRQSKRNKKKEKGDISDDSDVSPSKSRRKKDTPSKTGETESWQDAILESMEQSALKVRSEESFVADTEVPLSPTNDGKCVKALFVETAEGSMDKKEAEVTTKPHDDDSDEESNLVIDLSPTQKKESEKKSVSKMDIEEKPDGEEVDEVETGAESNDISHPEEADDKLESNEADVPNEDSDDKSEERILQDKEAEVATKDEMKNFIEKKRKNIVIRLKGETKVVNPKTGKAYNENPVGSAIQVLGQPSKPQRQSQTNVSKPSDEPAKHIHPIHGIVSVGSKPGMKPTSTVGSARYRSPSPVLQQAQILTISSGAPSFKPISPINQISSISTVGTGLKANEYIHPLTGQRMTYGNSPSVGQNIPLQGQTTPVNVLTRMPLQNLMPSPPLLQQPLYPVSNPLVRPVVQVPGSFVQVSIPQGLPIQSLGSGASGQNNQQPPLTKDRRSSSDVYDWFSDKFNKREPDNRNYVNTADCADVKEPNYEVSQNSAIKVIKTENIILNTFHRKSNIEVKIDPSVDCERKRRGYDDIGYLDSKKSRTDTPGGNHDTMAKELEDHSIETLSKVKDVIQSTLANLNEPPSSSDKEPTDTAASSELEDGEISDDDDDDDDIPNIPVPTEPYFDSRRVVYEHGLNPGMESRHAFMGAMNTSSPKRIVNLSYPQQMPIQTVGGGNIGNMRRVASEWSDMLADKDIRKVERVRSRNDPYLATRNASESLDSDASNLLSKSAASISKTKQKTIARSQVKTLGDWLKVELETENILPLQSIIPYSLNTDLTIIPKLRRRKIRQKVKNAIEQEGLKKMKIEIRPAQPSRPPINPNYLPEVNGEQLDKEMKLVSEYCSELRSQASNQQGDFNLSNPSLKTSLLVAFGTIEAEMKTLLQRTCFYGYPNRRVPNELLIESEFYSFRSEVEEVFLILMTPISSKPYNKLVLMKSELESLYRKKETASDQQEIDTSIRTLHIQRQALLRSFTGYLNKKRVNKLQDSVNKYTQVYEYLKNQQPPVPDTMMKYIRTTQMDLRQHLILAKQYLAMEEMKMDAK